MFKTPLTALAATLVLALPGAASAQQMQPGQHFIENWDFSEDGKVSLEEATERRGDIFAAFDADEDGTLSAEEYDTFDAARAADMANNAEGHGGKGGGMGGFNRSMERGVSDLNGDGVVTQEEFVGGTAAWFAMRDRNEDGFITTADFGPQRG